MDAYPWFTAPPSDTHNLSTKMISSIHQKTQINPIKYSPK